MMFADFAQMASFLGSTVLFEGVVVNRVLSRDRSTTQPHLEVLIRST